MTTPLQARSLVELFRQVADSRGGATALVDGDRELGYAELDAASDALAARVADAGAGPGDIVGVVADRSADAVVGLLGILKAGAAYLPLDPAYPAERLRYLVHDAQVTVVVGAAERVARLGVGSVQAVDAGAPGTPAVPHRVPAPGDPAYVIYTSGSTGRPKGCVVTHANVLGLLRGALPLFEFDAGDRWSLFHSFSFDFSVWELWGALAAGAVAVIVPDDAARSPERFVHLLAEQRVTVLNQVPSVFGYTALAYSDSGSPGLSLRYIIFGGESIKLDVVRDFLAESSGCSPAVVNMYGITETTVHVTYKRLTDADLHGDVRSPIGVPLPHLSVALRDEQGEPVPDGEAGEIWVAGDGVCAGYLNRQELTAERFVTSGGVRYYRSGDLARRLPDGELEFAGRTDEQVKLRGFRIELAEVEAVLRESPLVRNTVVMVTDLPSGARFLAACIVPAGHAGPDLVRELRKHTANLLPSHLAPDRYHLLDELPLMPSGKVDRAAAARLISKSSPAEKS